MNRSPTILSSILDKTIPFKMPTNMTKPPRSQVTTRKMWGETLGAQTPSPPQPIQGRKRRNPPADPKARLLSGIAAKLSAWDRRGIPVGVLGLTA